MNTKEFMEKFAHFVFKKLYKSAKAAAWKRINKQEVDMKEYCLWMYLNELKYWVTGCGSISMHTPTGYLYCPYCGKELECEV